MQTILQSGSSEKPHFVWDGEVPSPESDGWRYTSIDIKDKLPNYKSLTVANFVMNFYVGDNHILVYDYDSNNGIVRIGYGMAGSQRYYVHGYLLYTPVPFSWS